MLTPHIRLHETDLLIDEYRLPLERRFKLLKTMDLFLRAPNYSLSRGELIQALSSVRSAQVSSRLQDCELHNIVKSISRTRILLLTHLAHRYAHIEWFPYCSQSETWRLYRLHNAEKYNWIAVRKDRYRRRAYAEAS